MSEETVHVTYDAITAETDRATQIQVDDKLVWIPKSQIEYFSEEQMLIEIPEWLAYENGLI